MKWLDTALVFLLVFFSCAPSSGNEFDCKPLAYWPGQFAYDVKPGAVTKLGIKVDTSGQSVDLDAIDAKVTRVQDCMAGVQCLQGTPPKARCITIKIASDWVPNCDGTEQVLQREANPQGCLDKGMVPSSDCPCRYRAGFAGPLTIVTTPNMRAIGGPIATVFTGCDRPWHLPMAVGCL